LLWRWFKTSSINGFPNIIKGRTHLSRASRTSGAPLQELSAPAGIKVEVGVVKQDLFEEDKIVWREWQGTLECYNNTWGRQNPTKSTTPVQPYFSKLLDHDMESSKDSSILSSIFFGHLLIRLLIRLLISLAMPWVTCIKAIYDQSMDV
jgi:hypothetical protein